MSMQTGNCEAPSPLRVKPSARHKPKHRYVVEVKWKKVEMMFRLLGFDRGWHRYSKAHKLEDAERTKEKLEKCYDFYEVRILDMGVKPSETD